MGLVNIDVDCAGSQCSTSSEQGQEVSVGIFIACGTKPNAKMKLEVVKLYDALAREHGIRAVSSSPYYSPEEFQSLPSEVASMSLGCGNPLAHADLQPGEIVLDLGCGAGIDVFLAARGVGPAGRVVGVDIAEALLSKACETALKEGFTIIAFVHGDAEAIPFASNWADIVISNCAINLTVDKAQVFREAHRVLRNGGRLCAVDVVTDKPLPRSLRNKAAEWVRCLSGALTRDECVHLLKQAGFVDVFVGSGEMIELYGDVSAYGVPIHARKA